MKRLLTALLFTCIIGISYHASAAFINKNAFITDDTTGLDWLLLDETFGESINSAEAKFQGWRLASNADINDMFWKFFPEYTSNQPSNDFSYINNQTDGFQEQWDIVTNFRTTFTSGGTRAIGKYIDEDGIVRHIGTNHASNATWIFGPDWRYSWDNDPDFSFAGHGVYMVRGEVLLTREGVPEVPIPAAIWLFGTGLIALLGFARRKV